MFGKFHSYVRILIIPPYTEIPSRESEFQRGCHIEVRQPLFCVLAIGAGAGERVGFLGVKRTGIFAGGFSLFSLVLFLLYNDKKLTASTGQYTSEEKHG